MKVIKELAEGDAAYRSLTASWFEHSPLRDMFNFIAENKVRVSVTTDHGTILVKKPTKVLGERDMSTNLRYKQGRNMRYDSNDVFEIEDPKNVFLPSINLSSKYIFAKIVFLHIQITIITMLIITKKLFNMGVFQWRR